MTHTTVVILGGMLAAAALAATGEPARAQGGRVLNVGGASVVVARAGGRYQAQPLPRTAAVPRFRALSQDTKTALVRTATEAAATAAPGAALSKVSELPGGVTLVTARPVRAIAGESGLRIARAPARFQPLAAPNKDVIRQAALAEAGTAQPAAEAPATKPADAPFTLGPHALMAAGKAYLHIDNAQFLGGLYGFVSFINSTGSVRVVGAGSTAKQHMLHFQVFNPTGAAYDYTIMTGDGVTTKVSAKPMGTQDIVVFFITPANASMNPTFATLSGGAPQWYFIGVEVTPM